MIIDNEHTLANEYTLAEAASRLRWADTTLRDKVTANVVPHHRRHTVRGIFFTDEDIAEIRAQRRRQPAPAALADRLAAAGQRTREEVAMDAALDALAGPTRASRVH